MSTVHARKRGNKWEYRFEAAAVGGQRKMLWKRGQRLIMSTLRQVQYLCLITAAFPIILIIGYLHIAKIT